ncbi:uncharacterized protein (TIGR00297 family) [Paenibacillus shirakamiensis]|uniref:Uncharacterized protein (TIGR00297 family) n=1 Tax=Paenibacillus shirakamiensis TaxID=1265935 RepID=A0ABS4JHW7_9BACL|nr:DUF92 domain-containing protein [Paenibacillus shirakamiensis]MBP2001318.1 uncharacterized protein (TIGR00297 family) [Paenibacillus shirakamiensis]
MSWFIGWGGAALVAGAAYYKKSLTLSGMLAAMVMGTVYYGAGNVFWFGILLVFFITSTLLSKWKGHKKTVLEQGYEKSSRRDAGQVWANGGLGMMLCLAHYIWPHPAWIYAFLGVMGSVTADTWATELGGLSKKAPRSILTGRQVLPGTSGGISFLGSMALVAGALIIGIMAPLLAALSSATFPADGWVWVLAGLLGGTVGAFTDSLLGATLQRMYQCSACGREVEVPIHCGVAGVRIRGWSWMSNDAVNGLSSIAGGIVALLIGLIMA